MQVLIGADPEVFVRSGGVFTSAHVLGCGSKSEPQRTNNGSIQVDGLALEFNTIPTDDSKVFVKNVRALLEDLNVVAKRKFPDAEIVADPVAEFGLDYIQKLPPEARELGCDPDFNAYTGEPNPRPNGMVSFRTGSGHVHFGFGEFSRDEATEHGNALAKELDYYLGLPSLSWDKDQKRRELYGLAGTFRPKRYGVEYRTLSNAWLRSDNTMEFVFNQSKKAFKAYNEGRSLFREFGDFARMCVNSGEFGWATMNPRVAREVYGD